MKKVKLTSFIILVLAISSVIFSLIKLDSLSFKYILIPIIILILILFLFGFLFSKSKRHKTTLLISTLLSVSLIFCSNYLLKTESFISKIAGGLFDTHLVSAIVMKESSISTILDLSRQDIAINTHTDSELILKTLNTLNDNFDKDAVINNYQSNEELVESLYSGKELVILISESQRPFIEDRFPNFSDKTKIIFQHSNEVPIKFGDNIRPINVLKDTFTIFISGIDTEGPVNTVSRSDVNMLMTVNPRTHQILLTSMPRDTHVKLATKDDMDKLTNAGAYGVDESVLTIENFFNIKVDYYLKVNFSSVEQIVNALGGLEVDSQFDFKAGPYYFKKGINNLNGTETLRFVRERKNLVKGDDDRILNQQTVVKALLNKVMSPSIILNYSSFLSAIEGTIAVNMTETEIKAIIREQLDTMASWDIIDNAIFGVGWYSFDTYSAKGISAFVDDTDPESLSRARQLIISMNGEKRIILDH